MSALKIGNVLRAGLMAWAMFMDLNVRSGDNYVNISQSLVGTSGAVALAALACLLALSWADERLPKAGLRVRLAALFLGVWQVIAVSVVNTNDLNQPFLSGSQKLKAAVLALGMASLFELLFRLLEAGLDGRLDLRIQRDGALRRAYRAHTLLFCMAAVLLCWLPHLAVSYPASMNSDTQSQFDQILGLLPWSKHHPTLLAFFLLGTTRLGHALGSGNAGLTNFYRTFGGPLTLVVILCDVLKAVVAICFGVWMAGGYAPGFWEGLWEPYAEYWAGLFCLLGHMFPCMFHFKGGKGILSGGTIAIMIDWRIALVVWGGFLILAVVTKYVSLGSIWAGASFPVATWFVYRDPVIALLGLVIGGLVVYMHRGNIKRLLSGTENKFSLHHKKE